jgi:dsDNA-binding SOS-regulon protein
MSKYKAKKTEVDGITFDSKKEANYYIKLKVMEQAGEISDLELQKPFELVPQQREPSTYTKKGKEVLGKVIERKSSYIADFYYKDKDGVYHCVDTKGFRTADYILKRKLLLWRYGIRIEEV